METHEFAGFVSKTMSATGNPLNSHNPPCICIAIYAHFVSHHAHHVCGLRVEREFRVENLPPPTKKKSIVITRCTRIPFKVPLQHLFPPFGCVVVAAAATVVPTHATTHATPAIERDMGTVTQHTHTPFILTNMLGTSPDVRPLPKRRQHPYKKLVPKESTQKITF